MRLPLTVDLDNFEEKRVNELLAHPFDDEFIMNNDELLSHIRCEIEKNITHDYISNLKYKNRKYNICSKALFNKRDNRSIKEFFNKLENLKPEYKLTSINNCSSFKTWANAGYNVNIYECNLFDYIKNLNHLEKCEIKNEFVKLYNNKYNVSLNYDEIKNIYLNHINQLIDKIYIEISKIIASQIEHS